MWVLFLIVMTPGDPTIMTRLDHGEPMIFASKAACEKVKAEDEKDPDIKKIPYPHKFECQTTNAVGGPKADPKKPSKAPTPEIKSL